jgi:hypothetical protein
MNYDIIIAHHNENSFRERNLEVCLKYYLSVCPESTNIIIVEQNTETWVPPNPRIEHIKVKYDTDLFCKSKLLNIGIRSSTKSLYCIVDSDAILNEQALHHITTIEESDPDILFPYNNVKMMNEGETRKWIRDGIEPKGHKSYQKYDVCYTGFFMVMTEVAYLLLGGFDEEFIGWGAEDDAMVIKARRLANVKTVEFDSLVKHMFHPRKDTTDYTSSGRYQLNRLCAFALKVMPLPTLHRYINRDLSINSFIQSTHLNKSDMQYTYKLKNGTFTTFDLTPPYILPDHNGVFTHQIIFDGLYKLLGQEDFLLNVERFRAMSDDDDEKNYILSLIDSTIHRLGNSD